MENKSNPDFYKEHPKNCEPDDFWGQVKRTVNGKPVSQEQIDLIVTAIIDGLMLDDSDEVIDLCCGNGALTNLILQHCNGGIGVDFSHVLIQTAIKNFTINGKIDYIESDVVKFTKEYRHPQVFTKGFCYGSLSYIPPDNVEIMLNALRDRFLFVSRLFVGNLPNKKYLHEFFGDKYQAGIEKDYASPIGYWWGIDEFIGVANSANWDVEIRYMPDNYYASHYRFDAILTPKV